MNFIDIFFFCSIWLVAGFLTGMTSFGALMFAIPILTFIMDAKDAIVLGCVVSLAITTPVVFWYHKALPIKEFLLSSISCAAGVPLGILILHWASVNTLLLISSAILILFLIWQALAAHSRKCPQVPFWGILPAGFVSGILMGATGLSGPVLAMYAVMRRWSKETSLVVINMMCLFATFFFIYIQWKNGMLTPSIIKNSLLAMPITAVGVLLSIPVLKRTDPHIFRLLLLGMLAFSSIVLIFRALIW